MNRRNFLRTMVGGVAAGAAVRTFPFRVFSFPSEIVKPRGYSTYIVGEHAIVFYDKPALDTLKNYPTLVQMAQNRELPINLEETVKLFSYRMGLKVSEIFAQ